MASAYLWDVVASAQPASGRSKAVAVIVYSVLRLALFVAIWLVIDFLTPIHGLIAAAAAILISGAISVIVLDRQRGAVGEAAAGFFGRINARIEASARAEDENDSENEDAGSGDAEEQPESESVGQQEQARALQGGDQAGAEVAAENDPQRSQGEHRNQ